MPDGKPDVRCACSRWSCCPQAAEASSRLDSYDRLWEQLPSSQRAILQALAARGATEIYSEAVREEYRLGPKSSVQWALQLLDDQEILDQYRDLYFFVDPLFAIWITNNRQSARAISNVRAQT